MCQNVRAEFGLCADKHEREDGERTRLKEYARCNTAIANGVLCPEHLREDVHILQEDEPENYCPECRGVTPPETP